MDRYRTPLVPQFGEAAAAAVTRRLTRTGYFPLCIKEMHASTESCAVPCRVPSHEGVSASQVSVRPTVATPDTVGVVWNA